MAAAVMLAAAIVASDPASGAAGLAAGHAPGQTQRAAAEPFETVTETAFKASSADLDRAIAAARASALEIGPRLPAGDAALLDARLTEIAAARRRQDRVGVALAADEGFRILVAAVPADARPPAGVDLLDYAGYRYDADRRARPVRWQDMAAATAAARAAWDAVKPGLPTPGAQPGARPDPAIAAFGRALDGMDRAAVTRDGRLAEASVTRELDLVDRIETLFVTR